MEEEQDVPIFQHRHLDPRVKQWRQLDIILEQKPIRVVILRVPRFDDSREQPAVHDPVMHEYGTMWPVEVVHNTESIGVAVLLDVEPEREGVPEEERGGERTEKTLERCGTVFGDDANVNFGRMPVCRCVSKYRRMREGRTDFSILRKRGWTSSLCVLDRSGGYG